MLFVGVETIFTLQLANGNENAEQSIFTTYFLKGRLHNIIEIEMLKNYD